MQAFASASTAAQIGVSLSERGVLWWNDTHRMEWLKCNDLHNPVACPPPEDGDPPPVALFTRRYRVVDEDDPGPANARNVTTKFLPEKWPLALPLGHLVSFCEKVKNVGGGIVNNRSQPVDPADFGVRFDHESGVCRYTERYCARFCLEHQGPDHDASSRPEGVPFRTDCFLPPGQEAVEFIFGESITRDACRNEREKMAARNLIGFQTPVERRSTAVEAGQCRTQEMCLRDQDCGRGRGASRTTTARSRARRATSATRRPSSRKVGK